jgi:hypothetical protein
MQLETELNKGYKVVVPLGGTALRKVLQLPRRRGKEGGQLNDFHGAPVRDPRDRFWVVGSYHPSFLLRGAQKLTKTCIFDFRTAIELADGRWEFDIPELVLDPPIDWFEAAVAEYERLIDEVWLAVDIETPDKGKKSDEGELAGEDASYQIDRINLSWRPDQGITVPAVEPYKGIILKMLAGRGVKIFWNSPYDVPRLKKTWGAEMGGRVYDFMDAWHVHQPSLPRGLGFVAPFYSRCGPWKHLGNQNLTYCAMDAVQTLRIAYGVAKELQEAGRWYVYEDACYKRDLYSLRPAEAVGLPMNWERLEKEFIPALKKAIAETDVALAQVVPEEVKPLDGPYAKKPEKKEGGDGEWTGEVVEKAEGEIRVCRTCGMEKVPAKHRCKGWRCSCGSVFPRKPTRKSPCACGTDPASSERMQPSVEVTPIGSIRYYKKLRFNPASWQQVLAYIKFRGHKPGRAKKTGKDSTDKKTLMRLVKTGDPFYPALLRRRQADKMLGTYGTGMVERKGEDGRLHGSFGHLPWTMRLNSHDPNLQNLADHVEYAAEFKRCVEACDG